MIGTTKHLSVGKRVEIPAYADMWARGARFGTVERVIIRSHRRTLDPRDAQDIYRVRLDKANTMLRGYLEPDCRIL